jgi:dolichol-phosphate mannosyltransferase
MSAGFDYASGDVIATLDGDMQNDPHDLPMFLAKMAEGYELVSGWRHKRQG